MFQSGFQAHHSGDSGLIRGSPSIVDDIWTNPNLDANKLDVCVLLDLRAAFDTVDHQILLTRLLSRFFRTAHGD